MFSTIRVFILSLSIVSILSANLRGIIQYEINRMTQERVNIMVNDIAKHSIWTVIFCKNDMLYYEFNDEHLIRIKNIFMARSVSYSEGDDCKFLMVE